ncbi:cupredoxin family protein [Pseudomonas sp. S75]|uniref:cupredoxin domain-containing protein n=1 Tax=unclassified Pseudomonas TaxID=196821 RepID=UPI0019068806|nr:MULTISPECIES: cupredoxin family protein [unclassified Pseudomonas]MBJ9975312.1 cupredoxin family protein [Pseudomonas sp. S30]MBK0152714.1 cupredoxin family protein [Pseudomonas sp. S75]
MKSSIFSAALFAVSLPVLADGGHSFSFGEPAAASQATRTVQVVLKDIAFEPDALQVKAGETVRFVLINEGKLAHEFNLGDRAMHVEHQKEMAAMAAMGHEQMGHGAHGHDQGNTVLVQPGQRAELTWTFRKSAPIEFACNVPGHYQAGMVGPLTID